MEIYTGTKIYNLQQPYNVYSNISKLKLDEYVCQSMVNPFSLIRKKVNTALDVMKNEFFIIFTYR